ncbi:MAG: class I SAM-dependent methyltransferase [Pseudomonadota bacterium]
MKTKRRRKHILAGLPKAEIDLHRQLAKARKVSDQADLFGEDPPPELLTPYKIDWDNSTIVHHLQRKYLKREDNIRRCWNRIQLFLPELLTGSSTQILEMSTAHGAMLEILRHYGHDVLGNDYINMVSGAQDATTNARHRGLNATDFNRDVDDHGIVGSEGADWPYQEIIESLDLPMALFDAGLTPYPFEDKAFDTVICCQAIEHYCHPKDWLSVVAEFCRISRRSVLVLLNPILPNLAEDPEYSRHYDDFRLAMRGYSDHGFRCTSCHVHWGKAVGFKLTAEVV